MKKNNGFTLIELLAVIAILGILVSITTVAVNTLRKSQEEKNKENVISSILTGAKEYNAKEKIALDENSYGTVDVDALIKGNYVDFDTNKYTDLYNKVVTKKLCDNNKLKIQYSIKIGDKVYNDCGCEEQSSNALSKEICEEK